MKRVELTVAYDGTNYSGWQLQPNGNTIEAELNRALSDLLREPVQVIGSSRTDAGVHSRGTRAVFDTNARMPAEKMCFGLNERLPEDITILCSREVGLDFHPRKQNSKKTYEYRIYNAKLPHPLYRLYDYFFYVPLDVEKMQQAADYLVGEHDFKSFCSVKTQVQDTVRTLYELNVRREGEEVIIRVCGNGFLYNMVRILAGTLIKVGVGSIEPEQMPEILRGRNRSLAGPTAPAHGLTLYSYEYVELPPIIESENEDWCYRMDHRHLEGEKQAVCVIPQCVESEQENLIARNTRALIRNGAETIYLQLGWEKEEAFTTGEFSYEKAEANPQTRMFALENGLPEDAVWYKTTKEAYEAGFSGNS